MKRKIAVIGSGFSGLSAASYAAKNGHDVHVFEKNSSFGGRARQFTTENGFVFDMGPSWYWMPDIFDSYFADFGRKTSDFYELISLNPQFEMVFSDSNIDLPQDFEEMKTLFETLEPGSGNMLEKFMEDAKYKYEVGMKDFVNKPCFSWTEFFSLKILKSAFKLNLLSDFRSFVGQYFKNKKLQTLMEFPVIFLGASPSKIPALYSLMNYGGYKLGTYYPLGGFYKIIDGMISICKDLDVKFHNNSPVEKINDENGKVKSIIVNGEEIEFDSVIASCDYHHTDSKLLNKDAKNYSSEYWKSKTFAPSCLIFYLGIKEKLNIKHHTLFFENDLDLHTDEIYKDKKWPSQPLFYACCPSKTDDKVAPEGCENVFLLMPIATGIEDSEVMREKYFAEMIERLEKHTGTENLAQKIIYKKSYCLDNFIQDYNAYEGNAYGLANTLSQTAVLKPSLRNKKIKNLFYTGQLTVPGPGVPPSIISGKIAAYQATL
ncbi:phytoene desaturase [Chryseobacterium piscicola]|jgi:phytoene desaturase|uniref:Phytoene dehydrogenase n=3 Tax=Chryseobacterium TaxID=59732 RepID=A0A1N7LRE0_9FLAO|nr:phytoene desaturase family protein [Chryseobacterium piscicola]PQA91836.1 phytoene dehydrogenase [Chryseobacterium piscicola]SIS76406.1 phytoene desaturase [Chryseobacterium piscicola]